MDNTFKSRYLAKKEIMNNPFYNGTEIIVKVCGGYKIMSAYDYYIFKKQK